MRTRVVAVRDLGGHFRPSGFNEERFSFIDAIWTWDLWTPGSLRMLLNDLMDRMFVRYPRIYCTSLVL